MEVIRVESLSKLYDLGQVGTGTLSKDVNRWWANVRGKGDPYARIGRVNDRSKKAGKDETVWALQDINFSVNLGEVVGIIGRNGAGKSTLLKIISRITTPSTGAVKIRGRIASLLEVGTGFHPEMTGRENVFMNGTLLGMTRREIQSKLDEIIDFAGVELYIDTPVKRYSSGMQVRLGFAVAAFLEPEILIVDEVLAVGDAEFQKKAIGRMQQVSKGDGRTVLFVSHNMAAVKSLCETAILLQHGSVYFQGDVHKAIDIYLKNDGEGNLVKKFDNPEIAPGNEFVKIKRMELVPKFLSGSSAVTVKTPVDIEFEFWNYVTDKPINLSMHVYTNDGVCVFNWGSESKLLKKGINRGICRIPEDLLNSNVYFITMMIVSDASKVLYNFEDGLLLEVNEDRMKSGWHGKWPGLVRPNLNFTLESVE
jgi:lipopolysaccharide transport system ATP-binding protein